MGSASTHAKKRQRMRKTLAARGLSPKRIDEIMIHERRKHAQQRDNDANQRALAEAEQRCAAENERNRAELEAREAQRRIDEFYEQDRQRFDDARHRPAQVDSVLTGVARATGAAAVAVKRRRTLTAYEYQQREQSNGG